MPAIIEEDEEFKHSISSDYYNNICHVYTTKNGTDITLKDRKKEFNNNNMSLCESNCEYKGYNSTIKKAECNCEVKNKIPSISEILENKDELLKKIPNIKSTINLSIMKCYYTLFNLKSLKKNIGNYILLSMICISTCCCFIYLFKGNKMLNNIIYKAVPLEKVKIPPNNNNNEIINRNNNIKKKKKKRMKKNFEKCDKYNKNR